MNLFDVLEEKIRSIKYYNHLYSKKVIYSDFVRIYKFEHELRSVLLRYTLFLHWENDIYNKGYCK